MAVDHDAATLSTSGATPAFDGHLPGGRLTLGRYIPIEELGRGAMGRVVRAYDTKLHREVALKALSRTDPRGEGAARMVREARAMAKLSHPNVVEVYDVVEAPVGVLGPETAGLVIAMQYVQGRDLRQWQQHEAPSAAEIMAAYLAAGRGLAAAHAVGLLHRDFKPANVLLADDGVVKVSDFGLSFGDHDVSTPALRAADASDDSLTAEGMVVGTPRYMAPEQHRGLNLDPAADQFAFCVALWEALVGMQPYLAETAQGLMLVKTDGPPPWPGTPGVPASVGTALRRGLAPDPRRRWPSMLALLTALQPDHAARRRRWWALGAVGVGGAALAGALGPEASRTCDGAAVVAAEVWNPTRRAAVISAFGELEATEAGDRAVQTLDRYAADWVEAHTEVCRRAAAPERDPSELDLSMGCLRRARVRLDATAQVLAELDTDVLRRVPVVVGGLPPLSSCDDVQALAVEVPTPVPAELAAVERIDDAFTRVRVTMSAGRWDEASRMLDALHTAVDEVTYRPAHVMYARWRGTIDEKLGNLDGAVRNLSEALRLGIAYGQFEHAQEAGLLLMFTYASELARPDISLRYAPIVRGLIAYAPRARSEATYHQYLGTVKTAMTRYAEAEAELRQAAERWEALMGPDHADLGNVKNNLAGTLYFQGKFEEAAQMWQEVADFYERIHGRIHPMRASAIGNRAVVLHSMGRYAEAEEAHREELELLLAIVGPRHPDVARAYGNWGNVARSLGELERAEELYRKGMELEIETLGPDHPRVAASQVDVASALVLQGRYDEAEPMLNEAIATQEVVLGPDHPRLVVGLSVLTELHRVQGRFDLALRSAMRMLALAEAGPKDDTKLAIAQQSVGYLLVEDGRGREAVPYLEASLARLQRDDAPHDERGKTEITLARALWSSGDDPARARSLAESALRSYTRAGDAWAKAQTEVRELIAKHR